MDETGIEWYLDEHEDDPDWSDEYLAPVPFDTEIGYHIEERGEDIGYFPDDEDDGWITLGDPDYQWYGEGDPFEYDDDEGPESFAEPEGY